MAAAGASDTALPRSPVSTTSIGSPISPEWQTSSHDSSQTDTGPLSLSITRAVERWQTSVRRIAQHFRSHHRG